MDFTVSLRSTTKEERGISDELFESLKSMVESYDLAIVNMPAGVARDSMAGYFIGTVKPAKEAITRFKMLKSRSSDEYMQTVLKYDPHARIIGG